MRYVHYNPNPLGLSVGDCTIRAISCALDIPWDTTYNLLANLGYEMCDMPSSNRVWAELLYINQFKKYQIPDTCPSCYTIQDFAIDNPRGIYVVGTGEHVVCIRDGYYFDSWDSGREIPIYYFKRR